MASPETYAFAGFTLEVAERRLSRDGQSIALAPKAHDVLVELVRRSGRLISKRELLDRVWPEAFVEEGILAVHVSALRKALGDTSRPARCIETVSRTGYRFIAPVTEPGVDRRVIPGRWSIAVLPARSLTAGLEGDGLIGLAITDALIDRLGRFDPFVVRPTAAVHAYSGSVDDPAAMGRALRTDVVVDSSFQRRTDRVHLSARLLRSDDGAAVWSGEFDDAGGAAAAAAIADAVASHFGAMLPDASRTPVRRSGSAKWRKRSDTTHSASRLDVYELCGRGRAHLLSASMFEVPKAVEAFRAAIGLDDSYAPAHAGLALAYCAQAVMRTAPLVESYRDARAAALRALAMDDESADAQVALGTVLFFGEWDWRAAERSLLRALEMNPSHVQAYLIYGRLLDALGRPQEALAMKLRAFERDPFSPLVHVQVALSYWNQRQYDLAIDWANRALEIDPRHLLAREFLAGAYLIKGDFDRYLAESIRHAESYGVAAEALEPLKQSYASGGRAGVARFGLEQLRRNPNAPAFQIALISAECGDRDAAFLHLDRAILSRDPSLVDLAVAPQWDCLRDDPRFEERVVAMGLRATGPRSDTRTLRESSPRSAR